MDNFVSKFAFPSVESDGMTFRQYAAVAAMQAYIGRVTEGSLMDRLAQEAVKQADALIKELER